MEAGQLIAVARIEARLTQAQLARRAGTSQSMVARYENGAASPTDRALRRLLHAAGHELILATRPITEMKDGHPVWPALTVLREHRQEIESAAAEAGIRNLRVFRAFDLDRGRAPAQAELLVDFPVRERGLIPLITLSFQVEDMAGIPVDVLTPEMMAPEAASRAPVAAEPL